MSNEYRGTGDGSQVVCQTCTGTGSEEKHRAGMFWGKENEMHDTRSFETCSACQGRGWIPT